MTRRDGVLDTAWPWRAGVGASVVQQVGPPGSWLSPVNFPTFCGAISPSVCPLRSLLHCPGLARPAKGGEPARLCHHVTVCTYVRVHEGRVIILRSLFKRGFYPPKFENMVKMSDARNFFDFFWSGASCGPIVVSSIPRPQLLTELRAPTGGTETPPVIG